jgi:hypothetical protein
MSEDIKPCPWCGCATVWIGDARGQVFVECLGRHCGVRGPKVYAREMRGHDLAWVEAEALRRWNTRVEDVEMPLDEFVRRVGEQ